MELFFAYLKQRIYYYAVILLFLIVFIFSFFLYRLPIQAVIYPFIICALLSIFCIAVDFKKVRKKHQALSKIKSFIDIASNELYEANTIEEKDYLNIINLLNEEHSAYRTNTNTRLSDTVDYYTVWAHQIKTPISSMHLTLQNEDSELSRKLYADLHRIEQYVEMVITYLRLNSDSTDYVIKEYSLDNIIKSAVKKFSHDFIGRKIALVYEPVNYRVITDEKWLSFVIEQVLSNALKYTKSGSITISLDENKVLTISDTGIGIASEDLPRIFENGYTGFNGRTDKKASGIGLYLCKRICTNLGHNISVSSVVDKGTSVTIDLSQKRTGKE